MSTAPVTILTFPPPRLVATAAPPSPEAQPKSPGAELTELDVRDALRDSTFEIVFQPVVDLHSGAVVGCESLSRFESNPYRTPDLWFAAAKRFGCGVELELSAVRRALAGLDALPADVYVAVNVSPETLVCDALHALISQVPARRIVIELTEHARVGDYGPLKAALAGFKSQGGRLAIDDAGAGYSSFQHILELRPDIIKLDRSLTMGVDVNPVRYALASALVAFAASLGARICAEGIETASELTALQQLGVEYGQGYFLGTPASLPLAAPPSGTWFAAASTIRAEAGAGRPRRVPSPAIRSRTRLEALAATELMDADADEGFDRFTRLAARLLKAPVSLVSLVDDRRQFFKSAFGLNVRETPLSHSFCAHVVTARSPLVVEDARSHPLVRENRAVAELGVGAYAGMPIITADNEALGSFCVVAAEPRAWTDEELLTLRELATMASAQIDLRTSIQQFERRSHLTDALFECGDVGIVELTLDFVIQHASATFCALLERSTEEIVGKCLGDFESEADAAALFAARDALLSGAHTELSRSGHYLTAHGMRVTSPGSLRLIRDARGVPYCFLLTAGREATQG
jgi:EAL domain-containing protein (putative c-di-GMP-specific phosphodiesterase class I)/PAS domain-containing protein